MAIRRIEAEGPFLIAAPHKRFAPTFEPPRTNL
jgi:hypothetical protein